jgi:outer membrane lipoprotein carrier protein
MRPLLLLLSVLTVAAATPPDPVNAQDRAVLDHWISRQGTIRSLSADFVQTRFLRALKSPLAPTGRMWFETPNNFRWEMGSPAKNIILRKDDTIYLIEPEKKKATRLPVGTVAKRAGMRAGGMMSFPFAKNRAEFDRSFEVKSLERNGEICRVTLVPRDTDTKQFLKTLKLTINAGNGQLKSFEMTLRDGSALRNDFSDVRINERIPAKIWDFDLSGFKVGDASD